MTDQENYLMQCYRVAFPGKDYTLAKIQPMVYLMQQNDRLDTHFTKYRFSKHMHQDNMPWYENAIYSEELAADCMRLHNLYPEIAIKPAGKTYTGSAVYIKSMLDERRIYAGRYHVTRWAEALAIMLYDITAGGYAAPELTADTECACNGTDPRMMHDAVTVLRAYGLIK